MHFRPRELCSDCKNGEQTKAGRDRYDCAILKSSLSAPSHCIYYAGSQLFPVDVVIITAIDVELKAVLHELHPDGEVAWSEEQTLANGSWMTCLYRSEKDPRAAVRLAVAKTRVKGLSAAASLTGLAIQLFRPRYVVMLGITAGRQDKTQFGDIIVPLEVWDYGAGKWEEDAGELRFKPRGVHEAIQEHVRQRCDRLATRRKEALRSIRNDWMERYPDETPHAIPKVHIERMVSGAAVVNAEEIWRLVFEQNDEIFALDMEAYGVALATYSAGTGSFYNPSCLIAKSVCDFGVRKMDGAQKYAAYTSVRFFRLYLDDLVTIDLPNAAAVRYVNPTE